MEPDTTPLEPAVDSATNTTFKKHFCTVTTFSKYVALALFVVLPFLGGWVGYHYAPEKVKEVEKVMLVENENNNEPTFESKDIATTTVKMGAYAIRYSNDKIEVYDGPRIVQTIPWDTTFRKVFTDDDSLLITNRDFNYDHYLDLGILANVGYAGLNRFYQLYTYNPETKKLERMTEFDTFETDISNVVNPDFRINDKTIITAARSVQEYIYTQFKFDGEKYVKQDEWTEGWDSPAQDKINELLQEPEKNLEPCSSQDEQMSCFGSGRERRSDLDTEQFTIYSLVSNESRQMYGLVDKETGEMFTLSVSETLNEAVVQEKKIAMR